MLDPMQVGSVFSALVPCKLQFFGQFAGKTLQLLPQPHLSPLEL